MADEHDAGIDKQKLLDEIVGASTAPEIAAPSSQPLPAAPEAAPPALPVVNVPPQINAILRTPQRVVQNSEPPSTLREFRNEVAAMTLGICGVVWSAVGLARQAWLPGGVGFLLLTLALVVWLREVLRDE